MNKLKQEYIGAVIIITESTNKTLIGLKGKIIDETKNTFKIKTSKGEKIVLKSAITIKVNENKINGKTIQKKSFDRIKIKQND